MRMLGYNAVYGTSPIDTGYDQNNTSPGGYVQTYGAYSNKYQEALIRLFSDCYEEVGGCEVCPVIEKCINWWHTMVCDRETRQITEKEYWQLAEEFKAIRLQALQGAFLILFQIQYDNFNQDLQRCPAQASSQFEQRQVIDTLVPCHYGEDTLGLSLA